MRKKLPNSIDMRVGARVRMRRQMLSMNQAKLADALGLTFQQVQKYEKGTNRIGASRLQHIASVLQVSPDFFFEGASDQPDVNGKPGLPDYISEFLAMPECLPLTRAFTRLSSASLRRSIIALVKEMAGDDTDR